MKIIISETQYDKLKKTLIEELNIDEITIGLGDDIEIDEDCGCPLNQPEPTDVKQSQWFSDVDGERVVDKNFNQ